jgi:hypothetical protein
MIIHPGPSNPGYTAVTKDLSLTLLIIETKNFLSAHFDSMASMDRSLSKPQVYSTIATFHLSQPRSSFSGCSSHLHISTQIATGFHAQKRDSQSQDERNPEATIVYRTKSISVLLYSVPSYLYSIYSSIKNNKSKRLLQPRKLLFLLPQHPIKIIPKKKTVLFIR